MDNENKGYEPEMNQDADIYEDIADKPEENAEALSSEQTEAENAGELGSEQTEALEDTAEPAGTPQTQYTVQESGYAAGAAAQTYPPKAAKKKKRRSSPWVAVSMVCMLIAAACIATSVYFFLERSDPVDTPDNGSDTVLQDPDINRGETPDYTSSQNSETGELDNTSAINKALPSIVYIEVNGRYSSGSGSGVIMTEDGYILTCAHVISGASQISVMTNDGQTYEASLVGYDETEDIGVIKIEGTFTPAEFGDSDKIVAGQEVIAIGTPYSKMFFQTSTKGIVSAVRDNMTFSSLNLTLDVIQHDAAINSGNSGGALINMYGQVIGINSIKMSGEYENLGFAIQINEALDYAQQIIANGSVEKPVLGITAQTYGNAGGVLVASVTEGSGAEAAGLQPNDIITNIDGQKVNTLDELSAILSDKEVGDSVTLTVFRSGVLRDFTVTLGSSSN